MKEFKVICLVFALALAVGVIGTQAQTTTLDSLDEASDPPSGWTKFLAAWSGGPPTDPVAMGGTSHGGRTGMELDLSDDNGSDLVVKGFPLLPGKSGHLYIDMAVPTGNLGHWIETGYCIYEGDPGSATAAADFDAMQPYPGGTGHDLDDPTDSWRLIVKFDGFGLGADNADTWTTYSTALPAGSYGGGSVPGGIISTASETNPFLYVGFKNGNTDTSTFYDELRIDTSLVEESANAGMPGAEWNLYH